MKQGACLNEAKGSIIAKPSHLKWMLLRFWVNLFRPCKAARQADTSFLKNGEEGARKRLRWNDERGDL